MNAQHPREMLKVPGYKGLATRVGKGDLVRIVDVEGTQIGDLFVISADDPHEVLSPPITRLIHFHMFPKEGEAFYSTSRRPMLTLLKDTSPGPHDMTFAPCDAEFYADLGAGEDHPNCRDNYNRAVAALGVDIPQAPPPINLFQNSPAFPDGEFKVGRTKSAPGDYVEFRAEMDLILALTACSVDLLLDGVLPNGEKSTELRMEIFDGLDG